MSDHDGSAKDHDRSTSGVGDSEMIVQASQTLPLITEELAATHAENAHSTPTTTPHVTTPVMPPNPIRREESPASATRMRQEDTAAVGTPATAADATATVVNDTADHGDSTAKNDVVEKKEKNEGRVSATQLLAGAAAAATSSVIGGQLGVAGTVVGAGVASIITGLAVTLYTSSLDKGKEKIKEVGSKLAPAVKAKSPGAKTQRSAAVGDQASGALRATSTFGHLSDETAADRSDAGAPDSGSPDADTAAAESETEGSDAKSWWQKLRRKRVLYPVAIGVATFGIGLGAVVMAESFTAADISPGTSQISRSVTGNSSSGDESGTSQDGGSTSNSDSSGSASQSGQNPNQGSGNESSTTSKGQSTSASDGGSASSDSSATADQTGTEQAGDTGSSDSSSGSSTDSSGSSSTGADTSGSASSSDASGSSSDSQGSSSSGSGGSSSSSGSGSGSGSDAGGGSSSGGDGSAATAQG